jgi:hypothetical protein
VRGSRGMRDERVHVLADELVESISEHAARHGVRGTDDPAMVDDQDAVGCSLEDRPVFVADHR